MKLFQVDAFTDTIFGGNPAAVIPLDSWLPNEKMQKIAEENNLSETAFLVKEGPIIHLRWFTPALEVDLCGHATLAAAHVLFNHLDYLNEEIRFQTRSGILKVKRSSEGMTMDFPLETIHPDSRLDTWAKALGKKPVSLYQARAYSLSQYSSEEEVASLNPDMEKLRALDCLGHIATAPGKDSDFVSRFFAPRAGIAEDPVTGSAHCPLTVFWASRLGKTKLTAIQISKRRGHLTCELKGERVLLSGQAITYMTGEINLK